MSTNKKTKNSVVISSAPTLSELPATRPAASANGEVWAHGMKLPLAAQYSGLTVWHLRTAIWERKIPYSQEGKAYVILRPDLDAYLAKIRYKVRA